MQLLSSRQFSCHRTTPMQKASSCTIWSSKSLPTQRQLNAQAASEGIILEDSSPSSSWVSAPLKRIHIGNSAFSAPSSLQSSFGAATTSSSAAIIPPHYLALALRLPAAATPGQRSRGQKGVSIDLILDTGATANVISPVVARELALPSVGTQASGVGAAGMIAAAPIFLLGDVQLDYLPPEQRFTLMSGLQAAGLMVPSPGCSGILGRAFLDCFAATEFCFLSSASSTSHPISDTHLDQDEPQNLPSVEEMAPPSVDEIRFHESKHVLLGSHSTSFSSSGAACDNYQEARLLEPIKMHILGDTGLWGVHIRAKQVLGESQGDISNDLVDIDQSSQGGSGDGLDVSVQFPALVDTGAPTTVLNVAAAIALGLIPPRVQQPATQTSPVASGNKASGGLFGQLLSSLGARLSPPSPPLGGAVVGLTLSPSVLDLFIARDNDISGQNTSSGEMPAKGEGTSLLLGSVRPMIGDLPGFASLGVEPGQPAAILGLDALRAGGRASVAFIPEDKLMLLSKIVIDP